MLPFLYRRRVLGVPWSTGGTPVHRVKPNGRLGGGVPRMVPLLEERDSLWLTIRGW